jgi:hypothetical protein
VSNTFQALVCCPVWCPVFLLFCLSLKNCDHIYIFYSFIYMFWIHGKVPMYTFMCSSCFEMVGVLKGVLQFLNNLGILKHNFQELGPIDM